MANRLVEINFDGIIGPTHNYAGLSAGNLASADNAGSRSQPRAAALQGIEKMRILLDLGLAQGFLLPLARPNKHWLTQMASDNVSAEEHVRAQAWSASAMWAANAATISPAADTADGRCHATVANLMTMPHRSHEYRGTLAQMKLAFADKTAFAVHRPLPPPFGDEGAANHMRLTGCAAASGSNAAGIEIFVYNHRGDVGKAGDEGGGYDSGSGSRGKDWYNFPLRQHYQASWVIARRHGLAPTRCLFVQQSPAALCAGAFHNDVVAVANENVLLVHEQAFVDPVQVYADIRAACPEAVIIEVPRAEVSLADAVKSYLFNAQLITLPDTGGTAGANDSVGINREMALILPQEAQDTPAVWRWLEKLVAGTGPIRRLILVDLRQSMANGGGPACLRLRVIADPARVDPRFIATSAKLDRMARLVTQLWPEDIAPSELASAALMRDVRRARAGLLDMLDLSLLR